MPSDIQLSGMEVSLVNAISRETVLRQYLDTVKGQYSHILIDCQPHGSANGSGVADWQGAGFQVLDSGWDLFLKWHLLSTTCIE